MQCLVSLPFTDGVDGLDWDMPASGLHVLRHIVAASEVSIESWAGEVVVGLREHRDVANIPEDMEDDGWYDSLVQLDA